jgi:hypothetical protein
LRCRDLKFTVATRLLSVWYLLRLPSRLIDPGYFAFSLTQNKNPTASVLPAVGF